MQIDVVGIAIGVFLFGFLVGRFTSPKEKTTTVYQPIAGREITAADPQIEALLRAGQKIDAIKLYRQNYDVDLKEAKDAVDAVEARLNNR
jgi:ribosomal protein L7/L12